MKTSAVQTLLLVAANSERYVQVPFIQSMFSHCGNYGGDIKARGELLFLFFFMCKSNVEYFSLDVTTVIYFFFLQRESTLKNRF